MKGADPGYWHRCSRTEGLTKAEASRRIDELQAETGRGQ
ncbi:DUF3072 domain-containing protein [Micromonospora kangleipakensis]